MAHTANRRVRARRPIKSLASFREMAAGFPMEMMRKLKGSDGGAPATRAQRAEQ